MNTGMTRDEMEHFRNVDRMMQNPQLMREIQANDQFIEDEMYPERATMRDRAAKENEFRRLVLSKFANRPFPGQKFEVPEYLAPRSNKVNLDGMFDLPNTPKTQIPYRGVEIKSETPFHDMLKNFDMENYEETNNATNRRF